MTETEVRGRLSALAESIDAARAHLDSLYEQRAQVWAEARRDSVMTATEMARVSRVTQPQISQELKRRDS